MYGARQHIIFKCLTLFMVMVFLLPSAVKFHHIFENHKHEVCLGESDTHIHTLDIDCQFYKFNQNPAFTMGLFFLDVLEFPEIHPIVSTDYSFLSEYQTLHFSLRGPPAYNLI